MISVYHNLINNNVTSRDYINLEKYIKLIQWGRKNPIQFVELVFGITLMDYQKWLFAESWTKEYVVWAMSRNGGKSFLVAIFVMARSLLFPKLLTKIISENWVTANDTFKKLEDIATNNIKSIASNNTVFIDELVKTKSDSDGFSHDAREGNKCEVCNGSKIQAVAGASRTARGKRSNVNVYDESGFISPETFTVTEPFMSQDAGFKLGGDYDAGVYPPDIPNIRLYVGSASDTNSVFYAKYKEGTKQMLIGDDKYFVADINCEIPKAPTVGGKKITPLLSQAEIDRKMRENEIAAMREYYNIFDHFDLEDAVVTRSDIISNIINDAPIVRWGGKKHKYIIAYDPSSKVDNAPVLITEICKNEKGEIYGRFAHMENLFITYGDGSKKPMRIDEQVKRIRELLYEYNGRDKVPPYENVTLLIDAGAGGQAQAIIQELCKNWTDDQGNVHPGIYDENDEYSVRWAENYPKAITGCIKVIEPRKFRNELFEAAKLLVPMGLMKFTPPCPKYDTLVLDDGTVKKLNKVEINSLIQLDLMKEEMMAMVRIKSPTGGITYALPPEKRNRMHDDRNYVAVLSCWYIKQLRESEVLGEDKELNYSGFFDHSQRNTSQKEEDKWLGVAGGVRRKNLSPFTGSSPFKN